MFGPALRGDRISLEPPRREDLSLHRAWHADLEVFRYLAPLHGPSTPAQMEHDYEELATYERTIAWGIAREGQTIGAAFIVGIDWMNRQAETTLMLGDRSAWGQGYATEAVQLRTRYAFQELGLERLESNSVADNIRMHRALERSGYRNIGRKRHCFYRHGNWHDRFMFEVQREEWLAEHD